MKIFTLPLAVIILLGLTSEQTYAQMQGQLPLNPKNVPQFVDPLPHFAGQRVDASGGNLVIRYVLRDRNWSCLATETLRPALNKIEIAAIVSEFEIDRLPELGLQ